MVSRLRFRLSFRLSYGAAVTLTRHKFTGNPWPSAALRQCSRCSAEVMLINAQLASTPPATKHIGNLMSVDTTVKKVGGQASPHGEMDQTCLVSGKRVSLGLWRNEKPQKKPATRRDYETVGYVLSGQAELVVEGQTVMLEPGDSWLVPAGAEHAYRILTEFTAVEATSPPAQVHGRDEP